MSGPDLADRPGLRIALICPYSLSRPGGVQGQVLGLARALEGRGHLATVYAPVDHSAMGPRGVAVVPTGHSVALPANGSVAPVSLSVRAALRGVHGIRSVGYDIVHIHEPFTPGLPYGLLAGRGLPPLVGTFHRSGASHFYAALRPLTTRFASRLAVRCAVSEAARSTASDALGGEYRIGFNGVEVDRYRPGGRSTTTPPVRDADGTSVLFLGRHEERKGLAVLLEAFDRLDRSVGSPELWIAGDGPQTESLRRRHPESPAIHWLGVVTEEEKVERLMAADVLCAPSLGGESFGMVLLEAMAARTTVVASDIGGYRDAAAGHAVLVPAGDPAALARALAGVLEDRGGTPTDRQGQPEEDPVSDTTHRLDEARAWADHWSMDRLAGWYEDIYLEAMVSRPG